MSRIVFVFMALGCLLIIGNASQNYHDSQVPINSSNENTELKVYSEIIKEPDIFDLIDLIKKDAGFLPSDLDDLAQSRGFKVRKIHSSMEGGREKTII